MNAYIAGMDADAIWRELTGAVGTIPQSGLLLLALAAVVASVIAGLFRSLTPRLSRFVRGFSTLALVGVLVVVVLQVSRLDPRFEMAVPAVGLPEQVVSGGETRIPLSGDGHYWLEAEINGVRGRFLVDTGATLTTVNTDMAERAGLEPREGGLPVRMQTANGTITADMTTINELRFGNIAARGLDAVIAPNIGPANVIGMNLLSRLNGWRVEEGELVLRPNNPQPPLDG